MARQVAAPAVVVVPADGDAAARVAVAGVRAVAAVVGQADRAVAPVVAVVPVVKVVGRVADVMAVADGMVAAGRSRSANRAIWSKTSLRSTAWRRS